MVNWNQGYAYCPLSLRVEDRRHLVLCWHLSYIYHFLAWTSFRFTCSLLRLGHLEFASKETILETLGYYSSCYQRFPRLELKISWINSVLKFWVLLSIFSQYYEVENWITAMIHFSVNPQLPRCSLKLFTKISSDPCCLI